MLDQFVALILGESKILLDRFDDVCLGQGHFGCPLRVDGLEFADIVKDTGICWNCQ
jgi:hypothetical protein